MAKLPICDPGESSSDRLHTLNVLKDSRSHIDHTRRSSLVRYAPMHGLVAVVLAAYGLSEALDGSALLVAWTAEGVGLLVVARRLDMSELRWAGHALFVVLVMGLGGRLADAAPDGRPIAQPAVLSELVVLGGLAGGALLVRRRWLGWVYRGVALAGWLVWWFQGLGPDRGGPTGRRGVDGPSVPPDWRGCDARSLRRQALSRRPRRPPRPRADRAVSRIRGAFLAISYLLPGLMAGAAGEPDARGEKDSAPMSEGTDT